MARIYVGTYAKYTAGSLAGKWLDLNDYGKDDFYAACAELHSDETDPEFMFQDHEGCMGMVEESHIEDDLWDALEYIREADVAPEAVEAFINNGYSWDRDDFEDAYCGDYSHASDPKLAYAEELIDECYNLDRMMGNLANYFDYEAFARDLFMTDYWEEGGHIFRNI